MTHLSGAPTARSADQEASSHSANFPDPRLGRLGALRVWFSLGTGLLVSVDSPREARLVLKTIMAWSGHLDRRASGLQCCSEDGEWREWTDASGRTIHALADDDLRFLPPSQEPRVQH